MQHVDDDSVLFGIINELFSFCTSSMFVFVFVSVLGSVVASKLSVSLFAFRKKDEFSCIWDDGGNANTPKSFSKTKDIFVANLFETYPETLVRLSAPTTTPSLYLIYKNGKEKHLIKIFFCQIQIGEKPSIDLSLSPYLTARIVVPMLTGEALFASTKIRRRKHTIQATMAIVWIDLLDKIGFIVIIDFDADETIELLTM